LEKLFVENIAKHLDDLLPQHHQLQSITSTGDCLLHPIEDAFYDESL